MLDISHKQSLGVQKFTGVHEKLRGVYENLQVSMRDRHLSVTNQIVLFATTMIEYSPHNIILNDTLVHTHSHARFHTRMYVLHVQGLKKGTTHT